MVIFDIDVESLKQKLKLNGFTSYLVDRCIRKVLNKYHANVQCSAPTYGPDKRDVGTSPSLPASFVYYFKKKDSQACP